MGGIEVRGKFLVGDTFAHKEAIKRAGGRWDRDERAWRFSTEERAQEFAALLTPADQALREADAALRALNATLGIKPADATGRWVKDGDKWIVQFDYEVRPGKHQVTKRDGSVREVEIVSVIDAEDQRRGGQRVWLGTPAPRKERRAKTSRFRRACPNCGSTECAKAYNPRDLCDED